MPLLRFEEFTAQPRRAAALHAKLGTVPGGRMFGLWRAQIGPSMNRVTRASLWPGEAPPTPEAEDPDVVHVNTRMLDILTRGETPPDPARGGIVTHRWFILPPQHVAEMVAITTEAWTGFEGDTGSEPLGLWQDRAESEPAHVLLMTWYPSLAHWEQSRFWNSAAAGPDQARRAKWGALFARRRAMLLDTWVTVHGTEA
ncbi:hypothetical protein KPL78_21985 [Roseomonas sp. HJA6]|uniref:NIPSNAP domain-containing protein n=1 Tax=Roseomonas alba TaxID=2846776 RepID=A0ABS7AEQ3_9PROT|nr:hypothetical protein [Neoroseomonas alba]MBW6400545.1 hypothetical protein [Neoroseomonas alba]